MRTFLPAVAAACLLGLTTGCSPDWAMGSEDFVPVTDEMLKNPPPEDWLSWRRTLDSWGYSPLDQIDRANVAQLQQVWSRPMNDAVPNQSTPLVHDGVMYLVNSGDVIQALDAVTGEQIWEFRWEIPVDLADYTDWGLNKRNIAIYGDKIYHATAAGDLLAINARTGELVWQTQTFDYKDMMDQTSGPIVANGLIVSGEHCRPFSPKPGGCGVRAHDPETGKEVWKRYVAARPGEPGGDTWGGLPLEKRTHASTWLPGSYDPELNLIYWGTAVPAPSPEVLRGSGDGELLYTNSTLAIDPDDGKIVWYFQHLPRDNWDLDHPFERILVDVAVAPDPSEVRWINPKVKAGELRKVMTGIPGKTGIVWTLDRETGEFLWARETLFQNVIKDVDVNTGHPIINEAVIPREVGKPVLACPSASGGKLWAAGAYSPLTGMMYMPMNNTCSNVAPSVDEWSVEDGYALRAQRSIAASANGNLGTIMAISASTGKTAWRFDVPVSVNRNPMLATGGYLLFGGAEDNKFRAFDQETGKVLWEIELHTPATGFPISYSVDGRQYLAVVVGKNRGQRAQPEGSESRNEIFVYALPE